MFIERFKMTDPTYQDDIDDLMDDYKNLTTVEQLNEIYDLVSYIQSDSSDDTDIIVLCSGILPDLLLIMKERLYEVIQ